MSSDAPKPPDNGTPTWMIVIGWILTILPVLALLASGAAKIAQPEGMEKGFAELGWDIKLALGLGIVEIACNPFSLAKQDAPQPASPKPQKG